MCVWSPAFCCAKVAALTLMNEANTRAICRHASMKQPQITSGNMFFEMGMWGASWCQTMSCVRRKSQTICFFSLRSRRLVRERTKRYPHVASVERSTEESSDGSTSPDTGSTNTNSMFSSLVPRGKFTSTRRFKIGSLQVPATTSRGR